LGFDVPIGEHKMHTENLSGWTHGHVFNESTHAAERSTRIVMWITAAMMVIEIAAGWWYNSGSHRCRCRRIAGQHRLRVDTRQGASPRQ
jgi:hypothetical protein